MQNLFVYGWDPAHAGRMTDIPYTHGHHDSVLRSHRWRTAANSAGYLVGRLRPGMSLLDVGCGPGTITADLARLLAPGRVVGIDASASVIDEARSLAGDGGDTAPTFEVGISTPCRSRTAVSTSSMPIRCSSTSVTRWPPWPR
jgi:SAM-dependent methyltransferase